jgi:exopolysaccharide biosynthesis polyprenyl glycosylphosphotransferase
MFPRNDSSVERVIKVVLDLLALFLAANLAFDLRYYIDWGALLEPGPAPWGALYQALPYMLLGWFVIFSTFGLYRSQLRRREEFSLLIKATAIAFALIFAAAFFYRGFSYSRVAAGFMAPLAFLLTASFRLLFRAARVQFLRWRTVAERLVIVGRTDETAKLVRRVLRSDNPYELVGLLTRNGGPLPEGTHKLGEPADLTAVLQRESVDRVLLISSDLGHDELMNTIDACLVNQVPWAVVPDLYDLLLDRLHLGEVVGIPVMGPRGSNIVGMNRVVKRVADLGLAALLSLVLSPVMLLVGLAVKLSSRGPIFFIHDRVGRLGRSFRLIKFRTMAVGPGADGDRLARKAMQKVIEGDSAQLDGRGKPVYKLAEDPRITGVGRFLRRFSLDELPQLLNVLTGDMSLIGPRPAVPDEVQQYRERHRRRLEAQPGITGLWQVSGRNRLSFDEMVELDIHYIENWSAGLDIRIFFKTIAAVIFSRGY